MTLQDLPIHKEIANRLARSVKEGRVPHAQYLQGIDGGGNLQLAIAYAQEILGGKPDMFGGLDLRASRLEHPDLHVIFPMVQSVDKTAESLLPELRAALVENPYLSYEQWLQIRGEKSKRAIISKHEAQAISKKLSLRSFEGGHKVLIIWMAELMNSDCANKLLKLVEEPPNGSVILMVGNDADKLLPTIRSRTQIVEVKALKVGEITELLSTRSVLDSNKIRDAAQKSEGSIAVAIDLLNEESQSNKLPVMDWLRICYQRKVPETMAWCDTIASKGREEVIRTLGQVQELFHMAFRKNFIIYPHGVQDEVDTFTTKFSPFIHAANAADILETTDKAIADIQRNGNARIILLDVSFQIMRLLRVTAPNRLELAE